MSSLIQAIRHAADLMEETPDRAIPISELEPRQSNHWGMLLHIRLRSLGVIENHREHKLGVLSTVFGQSLTSSKELSIGQIQAFLRFSDIRPEEMRRIISEQSA